MNFRILQVIVSVKDWFYNEVDYIPTLPFEELLQYFLKERKFSQHKEHTLLKKDCCALFNLVSKENQITTLFASKFYLSVRKKRGDCMSIHFSQPSFLLTMSSPSDAMAALGNSKVWQSFCFHCGVYGDSALKTDWSRICS